MKPSPALLCKLGSLIVHVDEASDPLGGHKFDAIVFKQLLGDAEVTAWMDQMRALGMLPVKRTLQDLAARAKKGRAK